MIPQIDQNELMRKLIEKIDGLENRINEKDKKIEAEKLEWKEKAERVNDYVRYKATANTAVGSGIFFLVVSGTIGFSAVVMGVPALSTVLSTLGFTNLIVLPIVMGAYTSGLTNDVILGGIINQNPNMPLEDAKKRLFEITKTKQTIINTYDLKYM